MFARVDIRSGATCGCLPQILQRGGASEGKGGDLCRGAGTNRWRQLFRGREQCLVYGGFDDGFGHLAAFAALSGHAEFAAYITKSTGTAGDGFPDLAVGYCFAEANVHGRIRWRLVTVQKITGMRITVNKHLLTFKAVLYRDHNYLVMPHRHSRLHRHLVVEVMHGLRRAIGSG